MVRISKVKVTISLRELTALKNRISFLEERLAMYEPPEKAICLLKADGSPVYRLSSVHPLYKKGPKNTIDSLPDVFTEKQLEDLRVSIGKSKEGTKHQLRVWRNRGYVVKESEDTWRKTDTYITRIKQTRLVDIEY